MSYKFDYTQKESGELYSSQQTDNITDRDMLANAFETIFKSSAEYEMTQDYKGRIKILNEYEDDLVKINAEKWTNRVGVRLIRDIEKREASPQQKASIPTSSKKIRLRPQIVLPMSLSVRRHDGDPKSAIIRASDPKVTQNGLCPVFISC